MGWRAVGRAVQEHHQHNSVYFDWNLGSLDAVPFGVSVGFNTVWRHSWSFLTLLHFVPRAGQHR